MLSKDRYRIALAIDSNPRLQLIGIFVKEADLEIQLKLLGISNNIVIEDFEEMLTHDLITLIEEKVSKL